MENEHGVFVRGGFGCPKEGTDILHVSIPYEDDSIREFRVDSHGCVIQHGLPLWAWFLITGAASSALSVLTVWAVWR